MPKISAGTGATYAGNEGIVEDANGVKHQLDPERNLDGSPVGSKDGEEVEPVYVADPTEVHPIEDAEETQDLKPTPAPAKKATAAKK